MRRSTVMSLPLHWGFPGPLNEHNIVRRFEGGYNFFKTERKERKKIFPANKI
jgi:hypothetical protein